MRRADVPARWRWRLRGGLATSAAWAAAAAAAAGADCWSGGFTAEHCCVGAAGNPDCFDGVQYTHERCCGSSAAEGEESGSSEAAEKEEEEDEESVGHGDSVLFNEALPGIATSIRTALEEHQQREHKGLVLCFADGRISDAKLRSARDEVAAAIREAGPDPDVRVPLETPGVDEVYRDYEGYLRSCPQAVLQGTIAKLDRMLMHLRSTCAEQSLIRACQATTPFMFDMFLYYVVLKYTLIELYASQPGGGNITVEATFRGWPIAEQEGRMWHLFAALWQVVWPQRDYCACVEAYDYYATLHALFDGSLHLDRPDFAGRALRETSEARRVIQAASHCEEWIGKDFLRIFSSYAKHSACLPGAIMENVVCMHRWLLGGKVVGALNTAEMMVKLLALSGTCLEDTRWPFTRADVQYNFVRLALYWQEADVGCQAIDRFGQPLQQGPCPRELRQGALRHLLWAAAPLQQRGRHTPCTADFVGACVVQGVVTVAETPGGPAPSREALHSCSETGNNRHPLSVHADMPSLWEEEELERGQVGFVLNLPEASNNIWHNVHWLVPAAARLYGESSLRGRVPRDVVLLLLFEGYTFAEHEPVPEAQGRGKLGEQERYMEAWVVRQAGFLQLLTASPPVLLHGVQRRCFGRLLWGHAEMRADRELQSAGAVGRAEVQLFREALHHRHGQDLELFAEDYWRGLDGAGSPAGGLPSALHPEGDPVTVLLVQRDAQDLRLFEDLPGLAETGLAPLAARGEAVWRIADDLPQRSLVEQAGILAGTDVLVGAVGAALAWLVAMRPGGQVLEWLPRGVPPSLYRCSEAWNADYLGMFGGLGRLAGVDHVCLRSEAGPPAFPERLRYSAVRSTAKDAYWRRENLRVDPAKFARWASEAVARARRSRPRASA